MAWGDKLKTLEAKQRIFAEKAINDVLFEASLGNLTRDCVAINILNTTADDGNRQEVVHAEISDDDFGVDRDAFNAQFKPETADDENDDLYNPQDAYICNDEGLLNTVDVENYQGDVVQTETGDRDPFISPAPPNVQESVSTDPSGLALHQQAQSSAPVVLIYNVDWLPEMADNCKFHCFLIYP